MTQESVSFDVSDAVPFDGRSRSRFPGLPLVGVGHSMGGCLAVMQQAEHGSFDAVATLGYGFQPLAGLSADGSEACLLAETAARFAQMPVECTAGYYVMDRSLLRSSFYRDDVPADVVAADERLATLLPRAALHRVAATPLGAQLAAAVTVPVFQAWGEYDNTPNPHRDAAFFASCPDYTLYVLAGSGHCHNLAGRRHDLWRRLCGWIPTVVSR
jgi:pimeloyl-ACP methyl ester carboxylesterase